MELFNGINDMGMFNNGFVNVNPAMYPDLQQQQMAQQQLMNQMAQQQAIDQQNQIAQQMAYQQQQQQLMNQQQQQLMNQMAQQQAIEQQNQITQQQAIANSQHNANHNNKDKKNMNKDEVALRKKFNYVLNKYKQMNGKLSDIGEVLDNISTNFHKESAKNIDNTKDNNLMVKNNLSESTEDNYEKPTKSKSIIFGVLDNMLGNNPDVNSSNIEYILKNNPAFIYARLTDDEVEKCKNKNISILNIDNSVFSSKVDFAKANFRNEIASADYQNVVNFNSMPMKINEENIDKIHNISEALRNKMKTMKVTNDLINTIERNNRHEEINNMNNYINSNFSYARYVLLVMYTDSSFVFIDEYGIYYKVNVSTEYSVDTFNTIGEVIDSL